jgi:predicted NUDIX family NTP pyrophosphohydrolase
VKQSAGILMYKIEDGELRVLLVHPGGPLFAKRDAGYWSIPKGEYTDDEDALTAAEIDAEAEAARLVALGSVRQKSGKVVTAWGIEADFDVATLVSNLFELEWPPRSGVLREYPEVDRGEWFGAEAAREKINSAQAEFIDRLAAWLADGTSA